MTTDALLVVRNLSYKSILRDISLTLDRGRTLGVVGPSGSGKSTLARCIAGFDKPDSGEIRFTGQSVQLIFQQPAASLNPRFTAEEIVGEPLLFLNRPKRSPREALDLVGIPAGALGKRAREFSGGERQRLAIARALVVEPDLLILDESFAGLDPGLQNQIAGLLRDLQQRLGLAYLLISHDLELVIELASEIAVMEKGAIVEQGPVRQLLAAPAHPLTRSLIDAARTLAL